MNHKGLLLCSRYSFPPNSYYLCGPEKQKDLQYYSEGGQVDLGTKEILEQFSTMYPYLRLIATENNIQDPFDPRVVEAYWLGNTLLKNVSVNHLGRHMIEIVGVKKKLKKREMDDLSLKLEVGAMPHHAFHVLNVWKRTGHDDSYHTVGTMEACLIGWGKVKHVFTTSLSIETRRLKMENGRLIYGEKIERKIETQGKNDKQIQKVAAGDWISYHWGKFSQKLTAQQLRNLIFYTNEALKLANIHVVKDEKNNLYSR